MNLNLQVNAQAATKVTHPSSFRVVHRLPGRWRINVDGLEDHDEFASKLVQSLNEQKGVIRATISSVSGNAVVFFEPSLADEGVETLIRDAMLEARSIKPRSVPKWWEMAAAEVCDAVQTSADGLTEEEASLRRSIHGSNVVVAPPKDSDLARAARQFQSLPIMLLCGSAAVSVLTGGIADALLIGTVVVANVAIGFVSERRAETIIESFISRDRPHVLVKRGGVPVEVPAESLVAGDLLILMPGQTVAADARVTDQQDLSMDESLLTGESAWVDKTAFPVGSSTILAERANMVFAGTTVAGGRGIAVVVATGKYTEIGRIGLTASGTEQRKTPMQVQLDKVGAHLTWASLLCAGGMIGIGVLRGAPIPSLIRTGVALAVAAIPEGLPAAATSILAFGLREMQRHDVLIRRLDAVETLGSVSVVCFDKTGTLTQNRMAATGFYPIVGDHDGPRAREMNIFWMLQVGVLCNESQFEPGSDNHIINGSSTENALLLAAIEHGLDVEQVRRAHPLVQTIYRNGHRRYMMTCHLTGLGALVAIKGSPLDVLRLCEKSFSGEDLTTAARQTIDNDNDWMSNQGLRVLGFAMATAPTPDEATEYRWLGMIGLSDPMRPGMEELMEQFHHAGIRTVMATGDQYGTAMRIAQQAKLGQNVLRGIDAREFDDQSTDKMVQASKENSVFARVNPLDKLKIVHAMQHGGDVVAMIGDGANDGPALRASDVGISFGVAGTNAARNTADVLLGKDDMEMMIVAVRHGRSIYANIRKAIHFLVGTNSSEVMLTVAAVALGAGQPLNPAQLLWMNLVTDVVIALALGFEEPESDVMQQPPRARDQPVIGYHDYGRLLRKGAMYSGSALGAHLYGMARYGATGGGVGFMTLIGSQLLDGLSSRSETKAPWELPKNPYLSRSLIGLTTLQVAVLLVPALRGLLGVAALDALDLAVIGAGSVLPFLAVEASKARGTEDQVPQPSA